MVPLERIFLRNKKLEAQPWHHKESPFYKKVKDSIKKKGIINPLLCIKEDQKYMCCIGNNRYLAAHELGIKEVPVKVVTSEVPKNLKAATNDYIPTEVEGYPPLRRAYEEGKKQL
tara:strand:- start:1358 stop:1702 length:345 start_codon:yes stop_codon:yes gene_type:complete